MRLFVTQFVFIYSWQFNKQTQHGVYMSTNSLKLCEHLPEDGGCDVVVDVSNKVCVKLLEKKCVKVFSSSPKPKQDSMSLLF